MIWYTDGGFKKLHFVEIVFGIVTSYTLWKWRGVC